MDKEPIKRIFTWQDLLQWYWQLNEILCLHAFSSLSSFAVISLRNQCSRSCGNGLPFMVCGIELAITEALAFSSLLLPLWLEHSLIFGNFPTTFWVCGSPPLDTGFSKLLAHVLGSAFSVSLTQSDKNNQIILLGLSTILNQLSSFD